MDCWHYWQNYPLPMLSNSIPQFRLRMRKRIFFDRHILEDEVAKPIEALPFLTFSSLARPVQLKK